MDKNMFYIVGTILFDPTHPMWLEENINFGGSIAPKFWGTLIWQLGPSGAAKIQRMNTVFGYRKQASEPYFKARCDEKLKWKVL